MEGIITAIHGDVIEVEFDKGLPNIHDALVVKKPDGTEIVLEVHDHISNTAIKCIALGFTQGLKRGMEVISTGWSSPGPDMQPMSWKGIQYLRCADRRHAAA